MTGRKQLAALAVLALLLLLFLLLALVLAALGAGAPGAHAPSEVPHARGHTPATAQASEDVLTRIREAELICLPMGSFYSSILANLLPRGVGRAIAQARCPKLYIPNMAHDPEMVGMSLADSVARLLEAVRRDAGEDTPTERILNLVLLDSTHGTYEMGLDLSRVKELGVEVVDLPLVQTEGDWPLIDAQRLVEVLLSLV